jgi:hypothetical protein
MGRFRADCNRKKERRAAHEKNPAKKGRASEVVRAHREAGGTSKAERQKPTLTFGENPEVYF